MHDTYGSKIRKAQMSIPISDRLGGACGAMLAGESVDMLLGNEDELG